MADVYAGPFITIPSVAGCALDAAHKVTIQTRINNIINMINPGKGKPVLEDATQVGGVVTPPVFSQMTPAARDAIVAELTAFVNQIT